MRIYFTLFLIVIAGNITAQHVGTSGTSTSGNIYHLGGNFGVGTSVPGYNLHVQGTDMLLKKSTGTSLHIRTDGTNSYINNIDNFVSNGSSGNGKLIITGQTGLHFRTGNTGTSSGTDRMFIKSDGNVGIGTSNPVARLTIEGTDQQGWESGIQLNRSSNIAKMVVDNDGLKFRTFNSGADFIFRNDLNTTNFMITESGRVGIQTQYPLEAFQIGDRFTFHDGGLKWIGYNARHTNYTQRIVEAGASAIKFDDKGNILFDVAEPDIASSAITWTRGITIKNNGNVGIGIHNTFGYKLAVNGTIGAKEVVVEVTSAWPDYVFSPDYNLTDLSDLETYLNENHHLPGIPSAQEVENGIAVGEMNAKLLEKVEELTLYIIQLKKENNNLKEVNQNILERIEKLENK